MHFRPIQIEFYFLEYAAGTLFSCWPWCNFITLAEIISAKPLLFVMMESWLLLKPINYKTTRMCRIGVASQLEPVLFKIYYSCRCTIWSWPCPWIVYVAVCLSGYFKAWSLPLQCTIESMIVDSRDCQVPIGQILWSKPTGRNLCCFPVGTCLHVSDNQPVTTDLFMYSPSPSPLCLIVGLDLTRALVCIEEIGCIIDTKYIHRLERPLLAKSAWESHGLHWCDCSMK